MEYIDCNLCGQDNTKLIFITKDRNWLIEGSFNLVRCNVCGLFYLNPRPDTTEIKKYYPDTYHSRVITRGKLALTDKICMNRDFACRLKGIVKYKKSGRFLDIGCGDGYFLAYLKKEGWQVYGVEVSYPACQFAKEKLGIDVFCGDVFEANYPDRYFDVVGLYDVLEHLHNPRATLLEINRILKDDGLLCLRVPNFNSLEYLIFRERWQGIGAPRHLFHFNLNTLKLMLEESRFKILKITNSLRGERLWGFKESFRYLLMDYNLYFPKSFKSSPEKLFEYKKPKWKKTINSLENLFFYPLSILAGYLQMGDNLMAYAKKKV